VLRPMSREVGALRRTAEAMSGGGGCRSTGFDTSVWRSIVISERALWMEDNLYSLIGAAYRNLSASVSAGASGRMDDAGCQEEFAERVAELTTLQAKLDKRKGDLEVQHATMNETQRRGLPAFIYQTMGWKAVAVLIFPAAVYGMLVMAVRVMK